MESYFTNFTSNSTIPFTTASVVTTTAHSSGGISSEVLGYIAVIVAVLLFGSNLVPVKKFETGDGVFFQWIYCIAIWLTGLVLFGVRHFPTFYPIAMLGGFLWCTGNMATVPIIKTIGLGQGILVWASFNLLSGWASGRFGWFGMKPEIPGNPVLNYVGVALCLVSAFVYMFMKTSPQTTVEITVTVNGPAEEEPLLAPSPVRETESVIYERLPPVPKRIIGTVMAVVAGILYGFNFTPIIAYKDNHPEASQNGLDYVFAHFCGILLSSTGYLIIYCFAMRNKPRIYNQAILPGIVSGVMWGIADMAWFIANDKLSETISFPIITSGPAMIGGLWGVFFREIRGKRNIFILLIAFAITITGSVLTGLSLSSGSKNATVTGSM